MYWDNEENDLKEHYNVLFGIANLKTNVISLEVEILVKIIENKVFEENEVDKDFKDIKKVIV